MAAANSTYYQQVLDELEQFPIEYVPALLKLMRTFRESITLKSAEESFHQGWQETMNKDTHPLSELWIDMGAESGLREASCITIKVES
jgi:hypothetical protein